MAAKIVGRWSCEQMVRVSEQVKKFALYKCTKMGNCVPVQGFNERKNSLPLCYVFIIIL